MHSALPDVPSEHGDDTERAEHIRLQLLELERFGKPERVRAGFVRVIQSSRKGFQACLFRQHRRHSGRRIASLE
jgi:hypothetical protein